MTKMRNVGGSLFPGPGIALIALHRIIVLAGSRSGDQAPVHHITPPASRYQPASFYTVLERMTDPVSPNDTIAAISTPPGRGGIGIVRLSGPEASSIAVQLITLRQPLEHARARLADVLDLSNGDENTPNALTRR
jgi:hypothetical protein